MMDRVCSSMMQLATAAFSTDAEMLIATRALQ